MVFQKYYKGKKNSFFLVKSIYAAFGLDSKGQKKTLLYSWNWRGDMVKRLEIYLKTREKWTILLFVELLLEL